MNVELEAIAKAGQEVVVNLPGHPMHGQIGETVGMADTIAVKKIRVHFDGHVHLFVANILEAM